MERGGQAVAWGGGDARVPVSSGAKRGAHPTPTGAGAVAGSRARQGRPAAPRAKPSCSPPPAGSFTATWGGGRPCLVSSAPTGPRQCLCCSVGRPLPHSHTAANTAASGGGGPGVATLLAADAAVGLIGACNLPALRLLRSMSGRRRSRCRPAVYIILLHIPL